MSTLALVVDVLARVATGVILHSTRSLSREPSIVTLTYFDKPDWREQCAPLLFSLERASLDYVIGHLSAEDEFPGQSRRQKECLRSPFCAQKLTSHSFFLMDKYIWVYNVLSSGAIHPDSLVFFADCTDAYLMCDRAELTAKFNALGGGIVHAAEFHMWPYDSLLRLVALQHVPNPYPPSPTPLRYGNTGQYAGRARDVLRFLLRMRTEWEGPLSGSRPWTWCCPLGMRFVDPQYAGPDRNETDCWNDQRCIHTYVAAGYHRDAKGPHVHFDHMADLFMTCPKMAHRGVVRGTRLEFNLSQALAPTRGPFRSQVWHAPRESSWPCWVHCSGPSKGWGELFTVALMDAALAESPAADGTAFARIGDRGLPSPTSTKQPASSHRLPRPRRARRRLSRAPAGAGGDDQLTLDERQSPDEGGDSKS